MICTLKKMIWPFRRKSKKRMARIVIDEPITSSTRVSVIKALKQIEDREFPALILRIDSPGGTVGDSQEIYSAIKRIKDKGCKVIASFGNISASGGVYIGVASDKIVANPGTITGSIGCLLYTSDAADDTPCVDLGGRRIIKNQFRIEFIRSADSLFKVVL